MKIPRNVCRIASSPLFALAMLGAAEIANSAPGDTEVVSVNTYGTPAGGTNPAVSADKPAVSADGRFVAFSSDAQDIAPGTASEFSEVYVRDRLTGTTERVTVGLAGQPVNGIAWSQGISADGRYVLFYSNASNLVPNDTNGQWDVFVRDRQTQRTVRANVGPDGAQIPNSGGSAAISADGRYVSFPIMTSPDLYDLYVKNLETGLLAKVTVGPSGEQANGDSGLSALSGDGRYVAFSSWASNLVPSDTNGQSDVFVRDRLTSQTVRISLGAGSLQGNRISGLPTISPDGRYVGFWSDASNLVPGDTNGATDAFLWDRQTGSVERVSVASNGAQANDHSEPPSISADGRFVAFQSAATNIVPGDTNETYDIFVRDRQTGLVERASVASNGTQANNHSGQPAISADGRFVVFTSNASNLAPNDDNNFKDIFIHEFGGSTPPPTFGFALTPTARAFGNQAIYTSTVMSFWLSNKGTAPLPIKSVSIVGLNPAMFSVNNRCGSSVAVGSGCGIRVTFRPTSVGDKSAKLRVVAGDNEVRTKALSGKGVRSPFSVSPTALDFGSVPIGTTTAAKVVTVSNTGSAVLPISSIALGGWNPYQFRRTHNCPANLAVGTTCKISVVFKPTTTGSKAALVQITPGSGSGAIRSVALAGAGR